MTRFKFILIIGRGLVFATGSLVLHLQRHARGFDVALNIVDFDDEEKTYLALSVIVAVVYRYGRNDATAFRASELVDAYVEAFGYELDEPFLFDLLSVSDGKTNALRVIHSRFAETRYIIESKSIQAIAQHAIGASDEWSTYNIAGDDWLKESISNILDANPQRSSDAADLEEIPASDRYVSLDDNQAKVDDLKPDLENVKEAIRVQNEMDPEDRLIALSEIAIFEETICQQRLSIDLIERFLNFCKSKIVKLVGAAVAAVLIEKISAMIDAFLFSIAT